MLLLLVRFRNCTFSSQPQYREDVKLGEIEAGRSQKSQILDESMTVTMNELPEVDKAALQYISDTAESNIDEDIRVVEGGVDMFLNSEFQVAVALAR